MAQTRSINVRRFFIIAVAIALLNPLLSGLILGIYLLSEPDLKREGRIITTISVGWGILIIIFVAWYWLRK